MNSLELHVPDEAGMEALGGRLAHACFAALRQHPVAAQLHLHGQLGAGKTTLVRGFLRALGHHGAVKSPTYTLIEPYEFEQTPVYHLDLYRLSDPEELEYLGLRDLQDRAGILLVEWPERGSGFLPNPDLAVQITYAPSGRDVVLRAGTALGEQVLGGVD